MLEIPFFQPRHVYNPALMDLAIDVKKRSNKKFKNVKKRKKRDKNKKNVCKLNKKRYLFLV